ncbi:MAG TPA: hypothetical protein PLH83_15650 [Ruminococcus sp.]|nr:hypothetical protein [Ruminococcus sp.]
MSKSGTTFSEYATEFFEVIEGGKGNRAQFVKSLLKMGQSENGKELLDSLFPLVTTEKGQRVIDKRQSDRLRKYLRGENDITEITGDLEAGFDRNRFIEELKDYEEAKLLKFAHSLHLAEDTNELDDVLNAIAEKYYIIISGASARKRKWANDSKGDRTADLNCTLRSYTLTDAEKRGLKNLCISIKGAWEELRFQEDKICRNRRELSRLTTSEKNSPWKRYLGFELDSAVNSYDQAFTRLKALCADLIGILTPKRKVNIIFEEIISLAQTVKSEGFDIKYPDEPESNNFYSMISRLSSYIDRLLRVIDKL